MPGWLTWLSETGTNDLIWGIAVKNVLALTLAFGIIKAIVGLTKTTLDDALFKPIMEWWERIKGGKK